MIVTELEVQRHITGMQDILSTAPSGSGSAMRDRDFLCSLPAPPSPMLARPSSSMLGQFELEVTLRRTQRAVAAIRALAQGETSTTRLGFKTDAAAVRAWGAATPLQRRVVADLWDRHAQRAAWVSTNSGEAAVRRLG